MDTRNVSSDSNIEAYFQTFTRANQVAQFRDGQLVSDYPPPASVIARSSAAKMELNSSRGKNFVVTTTLLPSSYPPSDQSVDELQPMFIRQMRLGKHHRGAKVLLRVLTPPNRYNAIIPVVEDLQGTAVTLQLYHHLPEDIVQSQDLIQVGDVLILKEPFFKCAMDNSYSLRVDHVSDVVWLEPFDTRIPDVWKKTAPEISSEAARMQGNNAVKEKRWTKALRLYTNAIRLAVSPDDAQLAIVNRSFVNLQLGRSQEALLDATKMNEQIPPTEKAMFREIRALYELRNFERCWERLRQFIQKYPGNNNAKLEMKRVETRLRESRDGIYFFASMYKQSLQNAAVIDCATFSKLVEVREAPGRGRGLFTVKSVRAGDLLLCEKAFVYKQCSTSSGRYSMLLNFDDRSAFAGSQAEILTQAIQNLYHNPELSHPFLQLHRGNYKPVSRNCSDGNPIVDSFLAAKIMTMNVFGAPRSTRGNLIEAMQNGKDESATKSGFGTVGIWITASYINHSCMENCSRSFIGDMQILRATTDMESGTELLFSYRQHQALESYDQVQRGFKHWGFACDCALCQAKKKTSLAQLMERRKLVKDLLSTIESKRAGSLLQRGNSLMDKIKKTYTVSDPANLPRLELEQPCFAMAREYSDKGDLDKSVDMLIQGLRSLGYDIAFVWPPRGGAVVKEVNAEFKIRKWGVANEGVPWALVNLYEASKSMAPSLSPRIFVYAQTAYSIYFGEDETFLHFLTLDRDVLANSLTEI